MSGHAVRVVQKDNGQTRSSAAARIEASGMVPGSQQFRRNWNLFMPCLMAPRFTMFLFFITSGFEAKRSGNPWHPVSDKTTRKVQWLCMYVWSDSLFLLLLLFIKYGR